MAGKPASAQAFNILIVAQAGRLEYEAVLFAASLAAHAPALVPRLVVAEPQPSDRWPKDPRLSDEVRAYLEGVGARVVPFENRYFGAWYPQGNKIEALSALPDGEPFVFFDTDTLITGALDRVAFPFRRPSASVRVEGTWPVPQPYHATYGAIWKSLYDRFGLNMDATLDRSQPEDHWRRHLYFNAGWFYGACPGKFGNRFFDYATAIHRDPGEMLAAQSLDPWLDQVALPLVIASLGGGRPGRAVAGLDGAITCHYRALPLLYARESDRAVDVLETVAADKPVRQILKGWPVAKQMIYFNRGMKKVRPLFDRSDLPSREQVIRNTLRREGWWMR